jgi:uncharacterized protein (TIGR04222 family)
MGGSMINVVVVVLLAVIGAGVVAAGVLQRRAERSIPAYVERDLTFYQVAFLAGGPKRVAETALAYLTWAGLIDVREGARTIAARGANRKEVELAPVEKALLATTPPEGGSPAFALGAAREAAGFVEEDLSGLIIPRRVAVTIAGTAVAPAVLAGVLAVALIVALGGRQTGLLPAIPVLAAIVALVASLSRTRLTPLGRSLVEHLRDRYDEDLRVAAAGVTSLPIERGLYLVALYGRPAMTGGLAPLRRVTGAR